MSAKATAKVWEHSKARGNEKLLLLCYADYAHDDGTGSYPSAKTLADKTGLDERSILNVRKRLVEAGEIRIRTERSEYGTPIIDIVYGDGSNAAVIRTIHEQGRKNIPPPEKSSPNSVVVSIQESPEEDSGEETTTRLGENFSPPSNSFPASTELLALWEGYGVVGEWLHPIAAIIDARPDGYTEVGDLLDYFDAWNHHAETDRKLGPAWLASQFKSLAQMSPNTPRAFRWMDHAPAPSAKGEAWRSYTAETDPASLAYQLLKGTTDAT